MSYMQSPTVRTIQYGDNQTGYVITASYDFGNVTSISAIQVNGKTIVGASFLIDMLAVGSVQSLSAVKSMQFCAEFAVNQSQPFTDGVLAFFNQVTGEFLQFGPMIESSETLGAGTYSVTTGVVSLVMPPTSQLLVVKGEGGGTTGLGSGMFGRVWVNLYSFERNNYVTSSLYNAYLGTDTP